MAQRAVTAPRLRRHVYADAAAAVAAASEWLWTRASAALAEGGSLSVVLAGGSTPRPLYEAASAFPTDWSRWHFYFTDERCVPPGHPERNDAMARSAWLDRAGVPPANVHAIPAELGPDRAAQRYARVLADVDTFDVVLLGMGPDGHTASLFPGRAMGDEPGAPAALAVHDAPKPPAERVTLSAARLSRARSVLLLVLGAGKRAAFVRLERGEDIPVARIHPPGGMDVFADRAAAGVEPSAEGRGGR